MSAILLDGRGLAYTLTESLRQGAKTFTTQHGRPPHLVLIAAGHDTGATVFGRQVLRASAAIGVVTSLITCAPDVIEAEMRDRVAFANDDPTIDGVVVLLPLPDGVRQRVVTEVLNPAKDVDGLGPRNAGRLLLGYPSFVPGTAEAVITLLNHYQIPIQGKHAVIVGRSNVGGKPVALQLLQQNATITICHSHTRDLPSITRTADILVASVGRIAAITGDMVRPGAVVVDAGINLAPQGYVGDVDVASVASIAGWLTPVPGGLGPLTHLMVIRHTVYGPSV